MRFAWLLLLLGSLVAVLLDSGCSLTRMAYRDLVKPDRQQRAVLVGCSVTRDAKAAQAYLTLDSPHSGELVYGPGNPLLRGDEERDGLLWPTHEKSPASSLACVLAGRDDLATLTAATPVHRFDARGRKSSSPAPLGEQAATAAIVVPDGEIRALQVWVPPPEGRAVDADGHVSLARDSCLGCRDAAERSRERGAEWKIAGAPVIVPWRSKGGIWLFSFVLPLALTADLLLAPWQPTLLEELRRHRRF
jgi:hypothetical protein